MTHRHEVSKCVGKKNGADRLTQYGIATGLQFVKIKKKQCLRSANKVKHNKMRYACKCTHILCILLCLSYFAQYCLWNIPMLGKASFYILEYYSIVWIYHSLSILLKAIWILSDLGIL